MLVRELLVSRRVVKLNERYQVEDVSMSNDKDDTTPLAQCQRLYHVLLYFV